MDWWTYITFVLLFVMIVLTNWRIGALKNLMDAEIALLRAERGTPREND